jgi:predicted enzyme related to lactoylglutathione lyase
MIFSEEPKKLTEFYSKVFDNEPDWSGGEFVGLSVGDMSIVIGPHSKVKGKSTNPERIMFNLETEDVESEFERIKNLGAKVIAEPYHPSEAEETLIATLADPDGNYFQLMSPMEMVDENLN